MLQSVSLSSFRAFEAAARNGSFRAAADELNLSPSAISHAVQKLEQELGMALFEREGRLVRLTIEGETLMRHVGLAFDELRHGVEAVSNRGTGLLRLHAAPSFATQWLSPRLSRFLEKHEGIEIRLAAGTDYARFSNDEFDADIVYGMPRTEGLIAIPLADEPVTPLCSPALALEITKPQDLIRKTLIQSDQKTVSWSEWFKVNNLSMSTSPKMRFDRSFLAIAAAVNGMGFALESVLLAEKELRHGELVAPFLDGATNPLDVGHRLVFSRPSSRRWTVRLFASWLLEELGVKDWSDAL